VDRQTLDRLMLDHLPAAQRFAVRLCGDVAQAEDVLHDAIVRAATNWKSFAGRSKFKTWLFSIIVNVWRDRFRGKPEAQPLEMEPADPRAAIDPIESAEIGQIVAGKISSLPPRQREVLVLIAFEQLSASEAAGVLGISQENVRVNLFHARQRLKQELAPYLDETIRERRRSTTR
jgi:RNA polymerase sigma-70 factor (ECF subfamily)